jgi:uncharacterized membrane protein YbaN (DUF454 family)
MKKLVFLTLGLCMVGVGIVGAFLPVLPSTIFFILAAYFFSRSSERLEQWLLQHPRLGRTLRTWREHRAMTAGSKKLAFTGMSLGIVLLMISAAPLAVKVLGVLVIVGSAVYVGRLPTMSR